ncbi:MAG: sigma-70 region 4 domain-containing protein [Eggerthellaceae bacterium]|nr:sigma-70 region 4 domain-containing protein [Eggerthellaceae bacterium]
MHVDEYLLFEACEDAHEFFAGMMRQRRRADYWRMVLLDGVDAFGCGDVLPVTRPLSDPTASRAVMFATTDSNLRADAQRHVDECELYLGAGLIAVESVRAGLGAKYADALDLHYMDGHTERDTADLMDVSRATVARWIGTALDWCDYRGRELFM